VCVWALYRQELVYSLRTEKWGRQRQLQGGEGKRMRKRRIQGTQGSDPRSLTFQSYFHVKGRDLELRILYNALSFKLERRKEYTRGMVLSRAQTRNRKYDSSHERSPPVTQSHRVTSLSAINHASYTNSPLHPNPHPLPHRRLHELFRSR
jgi:hypothetical protein